MPTVLLIGEDEILLQTRAAVLRTTGVETACCDLVSAVDMLNQSQYDLVVLCHSLPVHVCETLANIIRSNWPTTGILLICAIRCWEHIQCAVKVDEVSSFEPERLIYSTTKLLERRGVAGVLPPAYSQPLPRAAAPA